MAVSDFAELRTKIRLRTQDIAGSYWGDDELDLYLNDGQRDFVRRTRCLRKQLPIITKANDSLYEFPDDFLEFVRMVTKDGEEVEPQAWQWLREQYGEAFMNTTGATPEYLYADLDQANKFRFYPTPVPTVDVNGTTVNDDVQAVADRSSAKSVRYKGGIAYVADSKVWHYHPETGISPVADVNTPWMAANDEFLFGFTATGELYRMTLAGVVNHGTLPAGTYNATGGMCALTGSYSTYCIVTSTAKTYAVSVPDSGAISSEEITFDGASIPAAYVSCAPAGAALSLAAFSIGSTHRVYYESLNTAVGGTDVTTYYETGSTGSTDPVFVDNANDVYYIKTTATGKSLHKEGSLLIGEAGMPTVDIGALWPLSTDSTKLYCWGFSSAAAVYLLDLSNATVEVLFDASDAAGYTLTSEAIELDGVLFVDGQNNGYAIMQVNAECGDVVYVDGEPFASDIGIIVDVAESTDVTLFDSEAGGVTQFIDGAEAVTLFYAREPQADTVELSDVNPMVYYALWQCFMKEADQQSFAKADVWHRMYMAEVDRENRRRQQGYLGAVGAKRPALATF